MDTLTEAELAAQAPASPERIRRLVEIGVLHPVAPGRFVPADLQRVRIAAAYEGGGIALEDIALSIAERRMSFEYTDRIYPEASPPSGRTIGDLAEELGITPEILADLFTALGLPRPTSDRAVTLADERILPDFVRAWTGEHDAIETAMRAARLMGDGTRRLVEGWVDLFSEAVALPPEESVGLSVEELRPRVMEPAVRIAQVLEPMAVWLLRRHLEQALNAQNVETMEHALELVGRRPRLPAHPPAIVFADVSGFTALTAEKGDETAARLATRLAHLATTVAATYDGRLVKQLGDGVMLAFPRVEAALDAARALVAAAASAALPPLHVGVSAGPVIERDGDYFGRTVNLASRLSSVAGPGEILVNETVAEVVGEEPLERLAAVELKGLPPVVVLRLLAVT
jgi:adenylate cyclase